MQAADKPAGQRLVVADFANWGPSECANWGGTVCSSTAAGRAKASGCQRERDLLAKPRPRSPTPCESRDAMRKAAYQIRKRRPGHTALQPACRQRHIGPGNAAGGTQNGIMVWKTGTFVLGYARFRTTFARRTIHGAIPCISPVRCARFRTTFWLMVQNRAHSTANVHGSAPRVLTELAPMDTVSIRN